MEEEKEEDECGDTPAGRLTHSLLMQTAPQRASTSRRRAPDSREYRCVCVRKPGLCTRDCLFINSLKTLLSELSTNLCRAMRT